MFVKVMNKSPVLVDLMHEFSASLIEILEGVRLDRDSTKGVMEVEHLKSTSPKLVRSLIFKAEDVETRAEVAV